MINSKHRRNFSLAPAATPSDPASAVTRRSFMAYSAALIAASLSGTTLPDEVLAAGKKSPQKLVKYQASPKNGRKCSQCAFYLAKDNACKIVEGRIDANGWCLRWAKKKS